jgi:hypothetical protein
MMRTGIACVVLSLAIAAGASGQTAWHKEIDVLVKQGRGSAEGRAAWDRLSQAGPDALLPLLHAMNTRDTVASNWLRTAFDQIAERELKSGGKRLDADALLGFVRGPAGEGRARRLALELVEQLRPGTSEKLYAGWLNDPEFRYEAVARVLEAAQAHLKKKAAKEAEEQFRLAFAAALDQQQLRDAAAGLAKLGTSVSVAQRMGFLTEWYVIGPFDGMKQKGFHLEYPPERKVDLSAEHDGQNGKVRWKRIQVREANAASRGGHQALVNLREKDALGDADDAVAFAYTEFYIPLGVEAEFRAAADDNLTVYVNGKKVFAFEEWRNGVRLDRHRFTVQLKTGRNTVLVKVCQSAAPNPEPNWEFFLRIVDASGHGLPMKNTLPE